MLMMTDDDWGGNITRKITYNIAHIIMFAGIKTEKDNFFFYFSTKTYVVAH